MQTQGTAAAVSHEPVADVNAVQSDIRQQGLLQAGRSAVLNIPTGGGKTFLAREAIANTVGAGMVAVYLCPLRSLARETAASWQAADAFAGKTVGVFTGETGMDATDDLPAHDASDVLVATPERFDAWLRSWQTQLHWLARVGLLVVDELHTLGDGRRGATLEGVITRLRAINPWVSVLGLSATLGNPDALARWLGGAAFVSDERAIPLDWRIATFKATGDAAKGKAAIAAEETRATLAEDGQALVFVQSRPRAESLASHLANAGLPAAAHHAGLPRSQREKTEAAFRHGEIRAIVCTPTLAMGVNLPARKVVLHDLQRFERGEWKDLAVNEVWQLAGRAGRRGFDDRGEVVLLAPQHNQKAARRYISGRFEDIESAWHGACLAEQVLVIVGSGLARTRAQVHRVAAASWWGQGNALVPVARQIGGFLDELVAYGMVEEQDDRLKATRLGYVAVRHQLQPRSAAKLRQLLHDTQASMRTLTLMDILVTACASPDFNARLRVDEDQLERIAEGLNAQPSHLLADSLRDLGGRIGQDNGRDLVAAFRTALLLMAWTNCGDEAEAASLCDADPHELAEARQEALRLLAAMRAIAELDAPASGEDEPNLPEKLRVLQAMVATGLDSQHASLAMVDGIGPVLARRLVAAGIEDIEDLALAEPQTVGGIPGISVERARRWIEAADDLVSQGGASRYRDVARRHLEVEAGRVAVDVLRWQRARDLAARIEADRAVVTGGAEDHVLTKEAGVWRCDCQDSAKGHLCKHAIRVRHELWDPAIPRFDLPFPAPRGHSLADLWNQRGAWR